MVEPLLEFNFLGKCGLKVSNICLGTASFGHNEKWRLNSPRQVTEAVSHEILDAYAGYGGNFIDTADTYGAGLTEQIVGNWLAKQERGRYIVATKVFMGTDSSNINDVGLSRRHIIDSLEASLDRLKTHYVDLYQSHCWDAATPLDESLRTFDDLIRCGKVRYYGASNLCGWQLQKMLCKQQAMGLNPCISLQQQYSLLSRHSEFEELRVCENEGIAVLPWSPLKGGLLTGKYKRGVASLDPTGSRLGHGQSKSLVHESFPSWTKYMEDEGYWKLMDSLGEIGATYEKSVAQVALRWLLQKATVPSVIIGVTSVKQLQENLGAAAGWTLSDEEMQLLDEASAPQKVYPYNIAIVRDKANKWNK